MHNDSGFWSIFFCVWKKLEIRHATNVCQTNRPHFSYILESDWFVFESFVFEFMEFKTEFLFRMLEKDTKMEQQTEINAQEKCVDKVTRNTD